MPGHSDRLTIEIDGRCIDCAIVRSPRRRTIALQIDHEGLSIRAPQRASDRRLRAAVKSRADWISLKLAEWSTRPKPAQRRLESGATLPFLGDELRLDIIAHPTRARTRVERQDDRLIVEIDRHLTGEMRASTIRKGIERWYRREADTLFPGRVRHYAEQLGRPVKAVQIRDQKRRWGSCDSKGIIRLNWRLVGADPDLIDYVCAHEVAHLIEPNHSAAFWAVVAGLMPDWKARRQRLNATAGVFVPF
ncbi:M48 family metallopeptidase [Hyphobacterium sp.]|uniref:M48 family metallopeptidase n=1 Tax=Hyphobacterium sp. TaxID=2004662 RepID=UPI0037482D14